jgi:ferredoxin
MHRFLATVFMLVVAGVHGFVAGNRFLATTQQQQQQQQRERTSTATATVTMNKTPLTYNGKRAEFAPGSSMMAATKRLGMKVKTNCKKGDCGTCTVNVGGKSVRACVGKVPPAPKLKSLLEKGIPVR